MALSATGTNVEGFDVGRQTFSLAVDAAAPPEVVHEMILPFVGALYRGLVDAVLRWTQL
jgi:hypothetical protein